MARFILIAAVIGQPEGWSYNKFGRGTCIADSAANAQAGDLVWPSLCSAPSPTNMRPLDAAAASLMPGYSIVTKAEVATASYGGSAGENVQAET